MNQEITREEILEACEPNSEQINYDDLAVSGPTIYTVAGAYRTADKKVHIRLVGEKRYYAPAKNQIRMLKLTWGVDETWTGKSMRLFGEPTTPFKGAPTGGIEVSHASHITKPVSATLTWGNRKKKTFTILPLVNEPTTSMLRQEDIIGPAEIIADRGLDALGNHFRGLTREAKLILQPELPRLKERAKKSESDPTVAGSDCQEGRAAATATPPGIPSAADADAVTAWANEQGKVASRLLFAGDIDGLRKFWDSTEIPANDLMDRTGDGTALGALQTLIDFTEGALSDENPADVLGA